MTKNLYRELEMGVTDKESSTSLVNMVNVSPPRAYKSAEEADKELLGFNEDYWEVSRLARRGISLKGIETRFGGKYTQKTISYMIQKILHINMALTQKDGDLMRQQMYDEFRELEEFVFNGADSEDGKMILNKDQVNTLINIKSKIMDLYGIKAPVKIDVGINHIVSDAKSRVDEALNRFQNMKMGEVIDVTPPEPTHDSELETPQENLDDVNYDKNSQADHDIDGEPDA